MRKIYIYLIVGVLAVSCEDVIDVKFNEEDLNLYAVEAKITTESEPFVFLSQGIKVSEDRANPGVSNAIVTISDDATPSNTVTLEEDNERKGYYQVPSDVEYYGVAERTYTLRIETEGTILTASDILHPVETIDSIRVWPSTKGDKRFLGIFTYGKEPLGLGNNYKWDVYINDTLLNDAENLITANDEFVDGNYINGLEIFTDFHDPNEKSEREIMFMDTILVKQTSISNFAYDYYYQMFNQSQTGFLFSVPPANIQGNITSSDERDVLGLFTAHDVSVSNSVVVDETIENELDERP